MTTLEGSAQALVVIDAQQVILRDTYARDHVVAAIASAVAAARQAGVPVVWVQHSDDDIVRGSEDWKIVPELAVEASETIVHKHFRSSFVDTDLHHLLQERGVGHLVLCGAESNNCVRHTAHSALDLGYDVTLLGDAHTTAVDDFAGDSLSAGQVVAEQNHNLMDYRLPGRRAQVVKSADWTFDPPR